MIKCCYLSLKTGHCGISLAGAALLCTQVTESMGSPSGGLKQSIGQCGVKKSAGHTVISEPQPRDCFSAVTGQ